MSRVLDNPGILHSDAALSRADGCTQGPCKQVIRFVFVDTKARPGDVIDLHSDSRKPVAKIYQICRKKILSASEGNNIRLSTNYNKISNK